MWTNKDDVALLGLINSNLDFPTRLLITRARETLNQLAREKAEALDVAQKALNLVDTVHADATLIAKNYQEHLKQTIPVSYIDFVTRNL